jgi:uncharacterized repeat protein (TIGR01451 family)
MPQLRSYRSPAALALASLLVGLAQGPASPGARVAAAGRADVPAAVLDTLGAVPLHFEADRRSELFRARGRGYDVQVSAAQALVRLRDRDMEAYLTLTPVGQASGARAIAGVDRLPGVVNRYVGDPSTWETGLPTFGRVEVSGVAPGIDVVYYGNQQQLEYDFVVHPGADPRHAGVRIEGADSLAIDGNGDLVMRVGDRELRQQRPVSWQTIDGVRVPVESRFVLDEATGTVTVALGAYDPAHALVIDPVLVYSTWFGGLSEEVILDMQVDASGAIYVLGMSDDKAGFPTTPGAYQTGRKGTPTPGGLYPRDYFITKFNAAGTALVYSTLFGGSLDEGTWSYTPGALAVDAQGRVHFVGDTLSHDLPVTANAADKTYAYDAGNVAADAFYARLEANGALGYSTYIGGFRREAATGVAVDADGTAYVVGKTASSVAQGFVTTANAFRTTLSGTTDLFVQRYAPDGTLQYSTYFGGNQGEMERRADIVANGNGKVTFASDIGTSDLPIVNGFQASRVGNSVDGFVAQIDTNVSGTAGLLYSTYISGSSNEYVNSLAIDPNGFVYVGGQSRSLDFPVTAGAARTVNNPVGGGQEPWDGFVVKLDLTKSGAASRVYATLAGGNDYDDLLALAVDAQGRVHLTGATRSLDLPMVQAVQTTRYQMPPYVQILNPAGSAFVLSTYLGSNTNGQALYTVAVNAIGETYLGGTTNDASTYSDDNLDGFRLVNALQTTYGGGDRDAVIQKLGYAVDLALTKNASATTVLPNHNVTFTMTVRNLSADPGSGIVVHDNLPVGLQYVSCTATHGGVCGGTGNNRTVTFAQLNPGVTATIQLTVKMVSVTPGHQITNTATVSGAVLDPVPANNTASATVSVPTLEPTGDADGDGLPNDFEMKYGLDPFGGPGSGPHDDPDGDGKTNLEELHEGTHPRGFVITYLAEGATGPFFDTRLALANPTDTPALVLTRFQRADGVTIRDYRVVPARSRATLDVETIQGLENAAFSTLVEADVQVVADRTMTWDQEGYGSHAERGILTRTATEWYFAEGATHSNFNLFYLIQNPTDTPAHVEVTYLLPAPAAPLKKTYVVGPQSRFDIWVDNEAAVDPRLAALAAADVSAVLRSTNGVPIIAERAMYLDQPGRPLGAGHESAGVTAPATRWFLAEGATGAYFDLFVLIANPNPQAANVAVNFLLPNGTVVPKSYTVAGNSRFNIWVDHEDAALADTAVSTTVTSTNDVPIVVERAMWWPGPDPSHWQEAHNSPGETVTGTRWAMAEGEDGGPRNIETYVLVANTSPYGGQVRATVLFEDGSAPVEKTFTVAANSRFNIAPYAHFPETRGKRFGMIVESIGGQPIEIVVERAMYSDAQGVNWAAGTNALATKLQ